MSLSGFDGILPDQSVASNDLAVAISDAFPVSPGHTLVITKRGVPTWWEATDDERLAVLDLVSVVTAELAEQDS